MKSRVIIYNIAYYVFVPVLLMLGFFCASLLFDALKVKENLGAVILVTYIFVFAALPALEIFIMRYSFFKWYIDPIAAAEIPVTIYTAMLINTLKTSHGLKSAFLTLNGSLAEDKGVEFIFLIGLFIIGIIASFSLKRIKEQNASYRIINKLREKKTQKDERIS